MTKDKTYITKCEWRHRESPGEVNRSHGWKPTRVGTGGASYRITQLRVLQMYTGIPGF